MNRCRDHTHLLLTRHGETVWHADNRYAGAGNDLDLSGEGHAQADRLAQWARDARPDAVVTSPVRRAVETAAPSADAIGIPLQIVENLREVGFGIAEGRTLAELARTDRDMVARFRADPVAHPFPGAEPPQAAAARAAAALRGVAAAYPGAHVLVVAHNTLLRLGMCALLGVPISEYRRLFARLDNAAITELRVPLDHSRPASLLSLNVPVGPSWAPSAVSRYPSTAVQPQEQEYR